MNFPDWTAVREKAANLPWARAILRSLRDEVDEWLSAARPLPTQGAGWFHNYFCPKDTARLEFDFDKPHEHRCPTCGTVYSGSPYDEAWITFFHFRLQRAMRSAGIVYALTAEPAYASFVAGTASFYAERYADMPVHGQWAGKGKIMGQSLTEAILLLQYAQAVAFCRDGIPADRFDLVAGRLLIPGARFIVSQRIGGVGNIQCWHNAGVGVVGLVCDEDELVDWAVHGEAGLDEQIAKGVLDDGFWLEGSIGYHFYTLAALRKLCRALGEPYASHEALRRMYTSPLDYAYPDGSLWPNNDSAPHDSIYLRAAAYEYAYSKWKDEAFGALLAKAYGRGGRKRDSVEALLFGRPLPDGAAPPRRSRLFSPSGFAILRGESGEADACATLKFGPHGGAHGHPDKLAITYFARGRVVLPDLGSAGYGVPLHVQWYRRTPAHNTVAIDEVDQKPCSGRLGRFVEGPVSLADASTDAAYDGVRLRRRIALAGTMLVDLFEVEADRPHVIDLHMHVRGRLKDGPVSREAEELGSDPPYSMYRQVRQVGSLPEKGLLWDIGDGLVFQWIPVPFGESEETLFLAQCPDNPADKKLSAAVRRVGGVGAVFLSVAEVGEQGAPLSAARAESSPEGIIVTVERPDGTHTDVTI